MHVAEEVCLKSRVMRCSVCSGDIFAKLAKVHLGIVYD